jgi:ankyrin repeat protein
MRSIWHLLGADSPEEGLHVATANERLDEMRTLIEQGVDVDARIPTIMSGQSSGTALHLAATYGLVRPAELLVSSGAALDLLDGMELTPLMCACSCGGPGGSRVAMLLLTAGGDATIVRQSDEMTALKFAAEECEPEVIQALIGKGAEVDGPANTDQTALMLAARSNNLGAIQVLFAPPQQNLWV